MPNYKEWDVTQFNSATALCFWGDNKVFKEIIFEQTSHIYCKYRKMYTKYCCYLSYFPSTSPGTATRPSPASVHGLMGQCGRKSKNESGLPLPPASAYITVWTPVQVESVRLDLARRYPLQSLSEGTPQGQPVWGWMKIKGWGELCSVLRRRVSLKGVCCYVTVLNRQHNCVKEV